MTEEEKKKLARLERLVANVDPDNQARNQLGFHTDILSHPEISNFRM
jgi:hypothetical protein